MKVDWVSLWDWRVAMGLVGEAVDITEYAVLPLYFCRIVFPKSHDGDRKLRSTQNNTDEQGSSWDWEASSLSKFEFMGPSSFRILHATRSLIAGAFLLWCNQSFWPRKWFPLKTSTCISRGSCAVSTSESLGDHLDAADPKISCRKGLNSQKTNMHDVSRNPSMLTFTSEQEPSLTHVLDAHGHRDHISWSMQTVGFNSLV